MAIDLSVLARMVQSNVRLILPSIGAFFVRDLETGFRAENVTFSTFLRYDDGRLAELLSEQCGLSPAAAAEKGKEICDYIGAELSARGTCGIPGLGTLQKRADGQIEFLPGDLGLVSPSVETPAADPQGGPREVSREAPSVQEVSQKADVQPPQREGTSDAKETVLSRAQRKQEKVVRGQVKSKVPPSSSAKRENAPKERSTERSGGNGFAKFVLALAFCVVAFAAADFLWFGWVSSSIMPDVAPYFKMRTQKLLDAAAEAVKDVEEEAADEDGLDNSANGAGAALNGSGDGQAENNLMEDFRSRGEVGVAEKANDSKRAGQAAARVAEQGGKAVNGGSGYSSGQDATSEERQYGLPSQSNSYHVVVGSFEEKDNAQRYCSQLKSRGFSSGIIAQESGKNAVTVGSFPTLRAARQACNGVKNRFPGAWVLEY